MDLKGKSVRMEEQDFFKICAYDLADYGDPKSKSVKVSPNSRSSNSSFVRIESIPKPLVYPKPPLPGLNPSTAQFLFKKELKSSDVGPTCRIVIPKARAERYLPPLSDGDGIFIYMDDMQSARVWVFRFRYWNNNNSQMFVLEKTGDFVKEHNLCAGDAILIYKDEQTGRYGVQAEKVEREQITHDNSANVSGSYYMNYFQQNEMGTYIYSETNMPNYTMNFLGGPEITFPTFPNIQPSLSIDPAFFHPHDYF